MSLEVPPAMPGPSTNYLKSQNPSNKNETLAKCFKISKH